MTRIRHNQPLTIAWAIIVRELCAGPSTVSDLAAATGLNPETVMGYVRAMRRQKTLYVAHWGTDQRGRTNAAAYALGDRPDARRTRKPQSEVRRAYLARKRDATLLGLRA